MTQEFAGRSVVVTGGAGALGTAVVAALVDAGATVHVPVYEREAPADYPFASHERVTLVTGVSLDDEAQATAFYASVPAVWASIQVAGGFAMAPVVETSKADFDRMWHMNVSTAFLSCREAVRRMRDTGLHGGEGGRLVNIAARPALVPTGGMIAYATAKSAVAAMSQALAEELADENIWVNAVAPSIIDTPANRAAMPDADHGTWPSTEALAETILHLASPNNRSTRGAIVPVYGLA